MELLLFLESVRTPFLNGVFNFITHLGDEAVAVIILLLVFWCGNKKMAYTMLYSTIFSLGTNQILKNIFKVERPWVRNTELTIVESAREAAKGYSFPSGHSANATVIFGCIATKVKSILAKAGLVLLILLIGFSRMYLGVHSPIDVIASWIIGTVFIMVISLAFDAAEKSKKSDVFLNAILVLYAICIVVYMEITKLPENPYSMDGLKNGYTVLGLAIGLAVARYFDKYRINWPTQAKALVQILKCACGIILIAVTAFLIKEPAKFVTNGHYSHYALRYFAIVIVGGVVWPTTFKFWNKLGHKKEEIK